MEHIYQVAGIDVHKSMLAVVISDAGREGEVQFQKRKFGATAKEAFYVQINDELNPPATVDLGEVVVEIGLAPTRPAEYIVLRIGLWDGGAQISEG